MSKLVKAFWSYIFKVSNERKKKIYFLQIWGFCKIIFCSKIDVNLVSDVPLKPKIAHWKAFGVSNLPNKLPLFYPGGGHYGPPYHESVCRCRMVRATLTKLSDFVPFHIQVPESQFWRLFIKKLKKLVVENFWGSFLTSPEAKKTQILVIIYQEISDSANSMHLFYILYRWNHQFARVIKIEIAKIKEP